MAGQPGENIKKARFSSNPDVDKFWLEYSKETIKSTIGAMDERAKYMITTCASLIVINFGLLLAFPSQHIQITPQFFLVVSAAFFAISYFPLKKGFNLYSLKSIKEASILAKMEANMALLWIWTLCCRTSCISYYQLTDSAHKNYDKCNLVVFYR